MTRRPKIAALDLLCSLLLVVLVLIAPEQPKSKPSIETLGSYAIAIEWPPGDDDIDLHVMSPDGCVTYFANSDNCPGVNLERDDLGEYNDSVTVNAERTIIRQATPGEYVANVHGYRLAHRTRTVIVRFYRLAGKDTLLRTDHVTLSSTGDERTVFRFTLNKDGQVAGYSSLPKHLVQNQRVWP